MSQATAEWAVALFNRSVLKQAKYRRVLELLEEPAGRASLDIGADNGVISYLLRQRGGRWFSADLDPGAVASIRELVHDDVYQLDGGATPFPDRAFDQIVIVDFLEHIPDDRAFVKDLARILKPRGTLIINVPHLKPHSVLNRFRHRIGLTDEWHGHLRPGYSLDDLRTEYHRVKSCAPMCTVGCVHRVAQVDELREDPQRTLAQWFAAPVRGQPRRLPLPIKILKWAFVTSPGRGLFRKAAAGMSGGPRRS